MMRTRTAMTVAGSAASLVLLGGVAYGAAESVDTHPGPQVVLPSSAIHSPQHKGGADDPATHDAKHHSSRHSATIRHGADDPSTHDVSDDSGGSGSGGSDDSGSGHGGHGSDG